MRRKGPGGLVDVAEHADAEPLGIIWHALPQLDPHVVGVWRDRGGDWRHEPTEQAAAATR